MITTLRLEDMLVFLGALSVNCELLEVLDSALAFFSLYPILFYHFQLRKTICHIFVFLLIKAVDKIPSGTWLILSHDWTESLLTLG